MSLLRHAENPWIRRALYAGAFGLGFLLLLFIAFPSKMAARALETQLQQTLGPDLQIRVESVRPGLGLAVVARGVRLTPPHTPPAPPDPPTVIERVRVRIGALALMRGRIDLRIDADVQDGSLRATYAQPGDGTRFTLQTRRLPLQRLGILTRYTHLPPLGRLQADIDVTLDAQGRPRSGRADVAIDNLLFGEGTIRAEALQAIGGLVPLPSTHLGPVRLIASIEDGSLRLQTFETLGNDVRLDAEGAIDFARPMRSSRLRLLVRMRLDEGYVERAGLATALQMAPVLRDSQGPDGFNLLFQGTLGNPGSPQPLGR